MKRKRREISLKNEASRSKRQFINGIQSIPSSCNCLSKYTPINCKCTGMPSIGDELLCRCDRASLARDEENKQQCPCRKGLGGGGGGNTGWVETDGYFPAYRGEERNSDIYPRALSPASIHSACYPICHQSCLSTCTSNKPYTREIDPYRERERERYSSGYFVPTYANDQDHVTENSLLAADYSPTGCQVSQCRANCLRACSRILDAHKGFSLSRNGINRSFTLRSSTC
ncbi:hypothetical protein Mgra_00005070 [Meloidogyne graminicola]|uniref:Uncharacterized protein n=1 Tax=Meloidogyne graminicola TaxID=189291 RepID=A0A8S9ZQT7_9BILA|nr:hypothetical protein Mgra_00005070 [Meloidogyne graminicola]